MSDDNIVKFNPKPNTDIGDPVASIPNVSFYETGDQIAALPENVEPGALGFADMGAAFNMRKWLKGACEAAGGKMIGGGFGGGVADIDIQLDGCVFNITIRALER